MADEKFLQFRSSRDESTPITEAKDQTTLGLFTKNRGWVKFIVGLVIAIFVVGAFNWRESSQKENYRPKQGTVMQVTPNHPPHEKSKAGGQKKGGAKKENVTQKKTATKKVTGGLTSHFRPITRGDDYTLVTVDANLTKVDFSVEPGVILEDRVGRIIKVGGPFYPFKGITRFWFRIKEAPSSTLVYLDVRY